MRNYSAGAGGDLATNESFKDAPGFFFSGITGDSQNTFHTMNSTFGLLSTCQSPNIHFSGLDIINDQFFSWHFFPPPSFPAIPLQGFAIRVFNKDCGTLRAFYLSDTNARIGIGHNATHLYTIKVTGGFTRDAEIYDLARLLAQLPIILGGLIQPLKTCPVQRLAEDIHAYPDGTFWVTNSTELDLYSPDCSILSSFSRSDIFPPGHAFQGVVSNDAKTKLWVANGTVFEFDIMPAVPPTPPITNISSVIIGEQDGQVTPYDEIQLNYAFQNNLDRDINNVIVTLVPEAAFSGVIKSISQPVTIASVMKNSTFTVEATATMAGVESGRVLNSIVNTVGGTIDLAGSINATVSFGLNLSSQPPQTFTMTPTNGTTPLSLQYPDYSAIAGIPTNMGPDNPNQPSQPAIEYFFSGQEGLQHSKDPAIREFALEALLDRTTGRAEDDPLKAFMNVYQNVTRLLDVRSDTELKDFRLRGDNPQHQGSPGDVVNDLELVRLSDGRNYVMGNQTLFYRLPDNQPDSFFDDPSTNDENVFFNGDQRAPIFICIDHSYFLTSLSRAVGIPSTELTMSLLSVDGGRFRSQEGSMMTWIKGRWYFFDAFNVIPRENLSEGWSELDRFTGRPTGVYAAITNVAEEGIGLVEPRLTQITDGINSKPLYSGLRNFSYLFDISYIIPLGGFTDRLEHPERWVKVRNAEFIGAFLSSPADILVTDVEGRRTGALYATNGSFIDELQEIPGSVYSGREPTIFEQKPRDLNGTLTSAAVNITEGVFFFNLSSKPSAVTVTGTGEGEILITFASVVNGMTTGFSINDTIAKGVTLSYQLNVSLINNTTTFFSVPDSIEELRLLKERILSLPPQDFKNNPAQRKRALGNKINEVIENLEEGEKEDAVEKLLHDIRTKMDGRKRDDWITNPGQQKTLAFWIDRIIEHIGSDEEDDDGQEDD